MEENKEICGGDVVGSCLNIEKIGDSAVPSKKDLGHVCETEDSVPVDGRGDHVNPVVSKFESPKECDNSVTVPEESNISSESRTHTQVNSSDCAVDKSENPPSESCAVLEESTSGLSSKHQVSESIFPAFEKNEDKKQVLSSTEAPVSENVFERDSFSENVSEVTERLLVSDISQDECSVENISSKPLDGVDVLENNEEPQLVSSENAEEQMEDQALLKKDSSTIVDENADCSNAGNKDLLDSISNVDCKDDVQESDLECLNVDNSQLEVISCENSCDQDIKQMESVSIDEKNFTGTENEQNFETDPLLGNTSGNGAEQNATSDTTKPVMIEDSVSEDENVVNETEDSANETFKTANDNFDMTEADDVQELEDVIVNEDTGMEIGDTGIEIGDPLMQSQDGMMETEAATTDEVVTDLNDDVELEAERTEIENFDEDSSIAPINTTIEGEREEVVNDTEKTRQNPEDAVKNLEIIPNSEDVALKSEDIAQGTGDLNQKSKDVAQGSENITPESENAAQESENAAQEPENVSQKSETAAKESEKAVQESEKVVEESENVVQKSKSVTGESDDVPLESDSVPLESDDVAPETDAVALESDDVAPESDHVAPESEDVAMDTEESSAHTENVHEAEVAMDIDECAVTQETSVVLDDLDDELDNSLQRNEEKSIKDPESEEIQVIEKPALHVEEDTEKQGDNEAGIESDLIKGNNEVETGVCKGVEVAIIEDESDSKIGANTAEENSDGIESNNAANSNVENSEGEQKKGGFIEIDLSETDETPEKSDEKLCEAKDNENGSSVPKSKDNKINDKDIVNSEQMDVDEANESEYEKSSSVMDPCDAIDVSAMCETVIEEGAMSIDLGMSTTSSVSEKSGTKGNRKQGRTSSGIDDDEEFCIIPDSVPKGKRKVDQKTSDEPSKGNREDKGKPEVGKGRKIVKPTEVEKLGDKSPELRRTPGRPQRQAAKRAECQIKEIAADEEETEEANMRSCDNCYKLRNWITSLKFQENGVEKFRYFCTHECASNYKRMAKVKLAGDPVNTNAQSGGRFTRKCSQCSSFINGDEHTLSWETMDYCNEECLGKYQISFGSQCANCKGTVAGASLGKYCVRFGYDVKQFCCSGCLEEFKKGLKSCSYCLKDISGGSEGFLAPVGDKGQFKDFCTQSCMEKYDQMSNNNTPPVVVQECAVCNNEKVVTVEVVHKDQVNKFCSEPCFAAFRFVNGMVADQCFMCKKYFDKNEVENFSVYSDDLVHSFCSKTCMNVYILANRKIFPCHWCKVKKYNFDMIKKVLGTGQLLLVCSLNCLTLYESSAGGSRKRMKCDMCCGMKPAQYQLHMTDNSTRHFCSYQCAVQFQDKYSNAIGVVPTPVPADNSSNAKSNGTSAFPVISSVQSLAADGSVQNNTGVSTRSLGIKVANAQQNSSQAKVVRQIIVRPPAPKQMRNKAISCRRPTHTKGTHCKPIVCTKETQTEDTVAKTILIPVPVPIYVPSPMCMYSSIFPIPTPFPLPVPVPIFIPTTRNSAKGIMKEIKRIQDKIPTDPFEAELLMMAEIVAGEKKEDNSDSDSDGGDNTASGASGVGGLEEASNTVGNTEEGYTPETVDASNTFGDDMLQMALKMATELEEPADLEAALTPTTITPQPQAVTEHQNSAESEDDPEPVQPIQEVRSSRGRKRTIRMQRTTVAASPSVPAKRRRTSNVAEPSTLPPPEPQSQPIEQEKPDANMCLKYTLGVNAWKRWVLTKNAELEKAAASNRKLKLFKTEILQQTADELNYSLCLFVKEVRKPSGQEYAPDTIYYLCLGIQQYLFENGRIDNIFTDPYYEKFTECLDEVAKKFATLYNDSQYIVTRVEEEHLWESKQLGAHSPHVLLSTLMFFNTKHFNLTTVEEHMQLSFSHIMKHWKRNPNQSGAGKGPGGSRNVLLRFYPPQSALDANSKKKKVYEQQENEENPLRCPVKLYEFYLSKCPESVKTRNDVFYLLPERSCVPDSPVWYSTMALGKEPLMKMLHRVKMVKEINQALLKS